MSFGSRGAFTLIELMVACAIVAVLAGIAVGGVQYAVDSGRAARARSDMARIAAALEEYRHRYGDFPSTDRPDELCASLLGRRGPAGGPLEDPALVDVDRLVTAFNDSSSNAGLVFLDPWRRPYVYIYKVPVAGWTNPSFVLCSEGFAGTSPAALVAGGYPDTDATANRGVIGWDGG
ncbi:MAG TPA: prepilin-type N-terminal cleavage/methylation domain-containing protein [Candidatus Didemnitutus sp.]